MDYSFWKQQRASAPLYPDIEWSRPEQRVMSGRLGIIGGNKLGFTAPAEAYTDALRAGVGEVKVLLPDALKKVVPPTITDARFAASNPSGGLASAALPDLHALGAWATGVLMIGDAGRNSETSIAYEQFITHYDGPLTITRDAFDLFAGNYHAVVERPQTLAVISFAQAQKLLRSVYFPKILSFSMQLAQLVDVLHKFTITYPITLVVLHKDHVVVAHDGQVTTTPWGDPMRIWRGKTATTASVYWLWNPSKPLEAVTASLLA